MSIIDRRKFGYLLSSALASISCSFVNAISYDRRWNAIPQIDLQGDLKIFWNIIGGDDKYNNEEAVKHGFELVDLVNTYVDYPGNQKENIYNFIKKKFDDPWTKPVFFENTVKKNIKNASHKGSIFVHDIEFLFEENSIANILKNNKKFINMSLDDFTEKYYREWASWFSLACKWSKEKYPHQPIGIYGRQIFNVEYNGFARKISEKDLAKFHQKDILLWKYIDPYVDFYLASVYIMHRNLDSIYYMAANIEENYKRYQKFSNKPLYTYFWLRFYLDANLFQEAEVDDYMAEAAAIIPFFSGSKGIVLWGWEPKAKGQYYKNLPIFMNSLKKVAKLSKEIASAQLMMDRPAHILWREKKPLIRRLKVSNDEWIIMAINPWQDYTDRQTIEVTCDQEVVKINMVGKHTHLYHLKHSRVTEVFA